MSPLATALMRAALEVPLPEGILRDFLIPSSCSAACQKARNRNLLLLDKRIINIAS